MILGIKILFSSIQMADADMEIELHAATDEELEEEVSSSHEPPPQTDGEVTQLVRRVNLLMEHGHEEAEVLKRLPPETRYPPYEQAFRCGRELYGMGTLPYTIARILQAGREAKHQLTPPLGVTRLHPTAAAAEVDEEEQAADIEEWRSKSLLNPGKGMPREERLKARSSHRSRHRGSKERRQGTGEGEASSSRTSSRRGSDASRTSRSSKRSRSGSRGRQEDRKRRNVERERSRGSDTTADRSTRDRRRDSTKSVPSASHKRPRGKSADSRAKDTAKPIIAFGSRVPPRERREHSHASPVKKVSRKSREEQPPTSSKEKPSATVSKRPPSPEQERDVSPERKSPEPRRVPSASAGPQQTHTKQAAPSACTTKQPRAKVLPVPSVKSPPAPKHPETEAKEAGPEPSSDSG